MVYEFEELYSFRKQVSHILSSVPMRGLWSLHYPGTLKCHICLIWVFRAYMGVFDCFTYIFNNDLVSFLPCSHVPARSSISIEPCDCIAIPYTTRLKEILTVLLWTMQSQLSRIIKSCLCIGCQHNGSYYCLPMLTKLTDHVYSV